MDNPYQNICIEIHFQFQGGVKPIIHRSILALALLVVTSGLSAPQDCQEHGASEIALYSSAMLNNQHNNAMFVGGTRASICSSTRREILDIGDPTAVTVVGPTSTT